MTLAGMVLNGQPLVFGEKNIIAKDAIFTIQIPQIADALAALPKSTKIALPLVMNLANAKGDEFVLQENLDLVWDGDKATIKTQTRSIRPQRWSATSRQ